MNRVEFEDLEERKEPTVEAMQQVQPLDIDVAIDIAPNLELEDRSPVIVTDESSSDEEEEASYATFERKVVKLLKKYRIDFYNCDVIEETLLQQLGIEVDPVHCRVGSGDLAGYVRFIIEMPEGFQTINVLNALHHQFPNFKACEFSEVYAKEHAPEVLAENQERLAHLSELPNQLGEISDPDEVLDLRSVQQKLEKQTHDKLGSVVAVHLHLKALCAEYLPILDKYLHSNPLIVDKYQRLSIRDMNPFSEAFKKAGIPPQNQSRLLGDLTWKMARTYEAEKALLTTNIASLGKTWKFLPSALLNRILNEYFNLEELDVLNSSLASTNKMPQAYEGMIKYEFDGIPLTTNWCHVSFNNRADTSAYLFVHLPPYRAQLIADFYNQIYQHSASTLTVKQYERTQAASQQEAKDRELFMDGFIRTPNAKSVTPALLNCDEDKFPPATSVIKVDKRTLVGNHHLSLFSGRFKRLAQAEKDVYRVDATAKYIPLAQIISNLEAVHLAMCKDLDLLQHLYLKELLERLDNLIASLHQKDLDGNHLIVPLFERLQESIATYSKFFPQFRREQKTGFFDCCKKTSEDPNYLIQKQTWEEHFTHLDRAMLHLVQMNTHINDEVSFSHPLFQMGAR